MKPNPDHNNQRGNILGMALLVCLAITGVGLLSMGHANRSMKVEVALKSHQVALYAAEAGLENAKLILGSSTDTNSFLNGDHCWPPEVLEQMAKAGEGKEGGYGGDPGKGGEEEGKEGEGEGIIQGERGWVNVHKKYGQTLCHLDGTPLLKYALIKPFTQTYYEILKIKRFSDFSFLRLTYSVYVRNDDTEHQECANCASCSLPDEHGYPQCLFFNDGDDRITVTSIGAAPDGHTFAIEATFHRPSPPPYQSTYSQLGVNAQGNGGGQVALPDP